MTGIGLVINQKNDNGVRSAIQFKMIRELWEIVLSIMMNQDFLIGVEVIIKSNSLPILGKISQHYTPGISYASMGNVYQIT